jgi:apolipoprotein D and lipocalin family protein
MSRERGTRRGRRRGCALALALMLAGCQPDMSHPPPLAPKVDLDRLAGGWFIVANIPNKFEDGLVGMYDVYSRRPDGDIREDFYNHEKTFDSEYKHYTVHDWVVPGTNNAMWRVQIFWPVNFPFMILYVDPDYRYVLFGYPDRSLGWIYARKPRLDDATYQAAMTHFARAGYDTGKFRHIVQFPDQIGKPGFPPAP